MALVTTNTLLKIGFDQRTFPSTNLFTVNASTSGLALPFYAQFTGNITRVIMSHTVQTSYTNLDVGLMASNATGDLPSDTFLQTPNTISGTVNATPSNLIINLTNSVAVTKGQVYWLVFKPNASFSGILSIYQNFTVTLSYNGQWRSATRTSSVWSRSGVTGSNVIVGSSTRWYSVDAPTVPDSPTVITPVVGTEYGLAFTLNANHPAVKVKGISFHNSLNGSTSGSAGMTFYSKIYNAAGTLLYTFNTQDTDRLNSTNSSGDAYFFNATGSDIWFEPGTKYYLMLGMTGTFTGSSQWTNFVYDNTLSAAQGAFSSNYAERSSGGTITETSTAFMLFHLEIDAIRFDNASGGAGGYVNASPMFSGGFSG
jgi:hypothetical protein